MYTKSGFTHSTLDLTSKSVIKSCKRGNKP